MRQELGIRRLELLKILPDFRYRAEKDGIVENEICPVFIGFFDGEPRPSKDEVAATRWKSWNELCAEVKSGGSELSPWAQLEIAELMRSGEFQNLLRSGQFRRSKLENRAELQ